jgi:hypothetical protein
MPITIEHFYGIDEITENFTPEIMSSYHQSSAYTKSSLTYREQICIDRGEQCTNKSFTVNVDGTSVLAFIGTEVKRNGVINLGGYSGRPCIAIQKDPLLTSKITNFFFKENDALISKANVTIHYRDFLINGNLSILSRHLLSKGACIKQSFSQVIDLEIDEIELKRSIRKSYLSLINWGIRELIPVVFTKDNLTWEIMKSFRKLHIQESGKDTRTEESWKKQFDMVKLGNAFVVVGKLNNELVSAGFFTTSDDSCFYGASASRRDLFKKPIFHALMWTAITHAKKMGCRWFESGEQFYPVNSENNQPSEKELGISKFKAGFGGKTKMFLDLKLKCSGSNVKN